jgi:hypothetical protein
MKKGIPLLLLLVFSLTVLAENRPAVVKPSLLAISRSGLLSEKPISQTKKEAKDQEGQKPKEKKDILTPEQKMEVCLISGIGALVLSGFIFAVITEKIKE